MKNESRNKSLDCILLDCFLSDYKSLIRNIKQVKKPIKGTWNSNHFLLLWGEELRVSTNKMEIKATWRAHVLASQSSQ